MAPHSIAYIGRNAPGLSRTLTVNIFATQRITTGAPCKAGTNHQSSILILNRELNRPIGKSKLNKEGNRTEQEGQKKLMLNLLTAAQILFCQYLLPLLPYNVINIIR